MTIRKILKRITALSDNELSFKRIYLQMNSRAFDLSLPHHPDELGTVIHLDNNDFSPEFRQIYSSGNLDETLLFENGLDAVIYKHMRYLPVKLHRHTFLEIAYVLEGQCMNYIESSRITMTKGDLCIIAPNTTHALSVFQDDTLVLNIELRTSTFEKAFFGTLDGNDILSDFFTRMLYHSPNSPFLLFHTGHDKNLRDMILYAYDEYIGHHEYRSRMLNNIIMGLFIILLRSHSTDLYLPDETIKDTNGNLVLLLKYIQENYRSVTLTELSSFFHYSERQIQRILKDAAGQNFRDIIRGLKCKHAKELLRTSNKDIAGIAEEVGFSDVGRFRSVFKAECGMTPSDYRNQCSE